MKTLFRARVDKALLQDASKVCRQLGTNPQTILRMTLAHLVRRRELPFRPTAETPEDELLQPRAKRAALLESFYDTKAG